MFDTIVVLIAIIAVGFGDATGGSAIGTAQAFGTFFFLLFGGSRIRFIQLAGFNGNGVLYICSVTFGDEIFADHWILTFGLYAIVTFALIILAARFAFVFCSRFDTDFITTATLALHVFCTWLFKGEFCGANALGIGIIGFFTPGVWTC